MDRGQGVELTATGRPKRKRVRTVTGCLLCRKRRVKCDEQRPKCGNCLRHPLRQCEYEYEAPPPPTPIEVSGSSSTLPIDHAQSPSGSLISIGGHASDMDDSLSDPANFHEQLCAREVVRLMGDELRSLYLLNPFVAYSPETTSMADIFLAKLPASNFVNLTSVLPVHSSFVRKCFAGVDDDAHSRLLCAATAVLSSLSVSTAPSSPGSPNWGITSTRMHRSDIFEAFVRHVKQKKGSVVSVKVAGVGFTLLLCEALDPKPSMWRKQLQVMVEKSIDRGGPAWSIGVGPPFPGYRGGPIINHQPLSHSLYSEMASMVEIWACLTEGTVPVFLSPHRYERVPWLIAARSAQVKVSPAIPDALETMWGVPRMLIPSFGQAVALVAQRQRMYTEDAMVQENFEFEALAFRNEMENVWPARLEARMDEPRLMYGGQIWRLAILILHLHQVQNYALGAPELVIKVNTFYEVSLGAVSTVGHLTGWLWPILVAACASVDERQRRGFLQLLKHARAPIADRDNSIIAEKLLTLIWAYHDIGQHHYHLRDAIKEDPSLDLLIF
ncbi:hypothetical protein IAT38_006610 [Cryptococcus sp. DSM 104549]